MKKTQIIRVSRMKIKDYRHPSKNVKKEYFKIIIEDKTEEYIDVDEEEPTK